MNRRVKRAWLFAASSRRSVAPVLLAAMVILFVAGAASAQQPDAADPTVMQQAVPADRATVGGVAETVLFYLFAILTLGSGLGLCLSRNIVRMAVYLFVTLGSVAMLYFLLLANFIAVIQLIVYAGGTLVLLVFGVMLTSKSPWARFNVKPHELIAAAVVCLVFGVGLIIVVSAADWAVAADGPVVNPPMLDFGKELLTTYLVPFEVTSVLLVVVLVGAAYLARQE